MTMPVSNWSEWSQPSIEPFMEAVIHLASGDVHLTDNEISHINITARMFDSSYILFGPPEPATATLEIIDFEQAYNPVLNTDLVENVRIDFYLGLWPGDMSSAEVGENLVDSFDQPILVDYLGDECWATVIRITPEYLVPLRRYRLEYSYAESGSTDVRTESFIVPSDWFERHIYAIVRPDQYQVVDVKIYEVQALLQPYGVFFAQEWAYDTISHTASVDLIDSMNEALSLDNRASAALPAENILLEAFTEQFLQLYDGDTALIRDYSSGTLQSFNPLLRYSFYESDQATTVNKLVEALAACYFFLPDGSAALCHPTGAYLTDISVTDDDVESYDISQTSAYAYDSISVDYNATKLAQQTLKTVEDYAVDSNDQVLLFDTARVFKVDYLQYTAYSGDAPNPIFYDWHCAGVFDLRALNANPTWKELSAVGQVVESTTQRYSGIEGVSGYEISDNMYIQNATHAQVLYDVLDNFRQESYNTVMITLRGCSAFWPGAIISLTSNLYSIQDEYVIIELSFDYDGAVHTTLTMQKQI